MKIALVADPGSPHTRAWVTGLLERGFAVHVFSAQKQLPPIDLPARVFAPLAVPGAIPPPRDPHLVRRRESGADPWRLRTITRAARLVPAFRRWLREVRPNRLLALRFQPEGYLASWGGFTPYGLVSWGQDVLRFAHGHRLHRWCARYAVRRAALLLGETDAVTGAIRDLGASPARVLKGLTGIDLGFWRPPGPADIDLAREDLLARHPDWSAWIEAAEAGTPVVCSPRGIAPRGHQRELIQALAGCRSAPILVQLGMGTEAARDRCRELVDELGISERYVDLGRVSPEDLRSVYWLSDLIASLWSPDGLSQTLLEAMAVGSPVLAADISGNREWIVPEQNGLLAHPEDPGAIRRAVDLGLSDRTLRARVREAGRTCVEARADRHRNMDALTRLIRIMGQSAATQEEA